MSSFSRPYERAIDDRAQTYHNPAAGLHLGGFSRIIPSIFFGIKEPSTPEQRSWQGLSLEASSALL
jgi:hypothetical protein